MKRLGGGTWRGKQFIKWQRQVTKWEHTTKKSRSRTKKERTRWPWLTAIVQPASNKINDSIFVLNVIAVSKYTTERSSGKCKSKLSCNHRTNDLFISLIHCSSCWHTFMLEFPPSISIQILWSNIPQWYAYYSFKYPNGPVCRVNWLQTSLPSILIGSKSCTTPGWFLAGLFLKVYNRVAVLLDCLVDS